MATHPLWSDEYWLLLMQLYLKKPVGVKPLYSRPLVALSMELHIAPQYLYEQMFRLRSIDTPRMEKLWNDYGKNPKKLARGVKLLREKLGYGTAGLFYEGVETQESFELDFKPLPLLANESAPVNKLTPVMLIMILDQYFRLTPTTMVASTPEVKDLARLLDIPAETVVEVMDVFQICDPYLKRDAMMVSEFLLPCRLIWQRFGNDKPEKLAALAAQLKAYFV
jgi:hypothetical protein